MPNTSTRSDQSGNPNEPLHSPQWTSVLTKDIVGGEDHLGVEGAAQSRQQYLLPGIITVTDRARYYSFYAWVLKRFLELPGSSRLIDDFKGPFFRRHEVAFIAACYSHHLDGTPLGGLIGAGVNSYKARQLWEESNSLSLDYDYFQHKLGGFGQYYRSPMEEMGIIAPNKHPGWVYRLTTRGKELADAFEHSVADTSYFRALQQKGELERITRQAAKTYGEVACLCQQALGRGEDQELLRDAFFRFDDTSTDGPHVRRRQALGVVLDLVQGAGRKMERYMLRPALYLGEYGPNLLYRPSAEIARWVARWKMVEIRHLYTFGLQNLFAAFLLYLSEQEAGLTFDRYLAWACSVLPDSNGDQTLGQYLNQLCQAVGLNTGWISAEDRFDTVCRQGTQRDEFTLVTQAFAGRGDAARLVNSGLRILAQLFLRFLPRHLEQDVSWTELAYRERLPLSEFFTAFRERATDPGCTVADCLTWLYRDLILGQHEFIALEKLRFQGYDTFKFHYRDGQFYWPFFKSEDYREPIRLTGLRLNNVLTMLTDLGLVLEGSAGTYRLSADGRDYWQRVVGGK